MKGQANPQTNIALLIFAVAVLIVIYILMLPPAERLDLLEQNRTPASRDGEDIKDKISIVMTKEPGRLTNVAEDEMVVDLPSFNLFTRTDATILTEFDSFVVSKSLFDEEKWNISFDVRSTSNTDNYVLSFNVPKHEGVLTIKLNGQTLMSKEVKTQSPAPIKLSKSMLKDRNVFEFSVSGPGIEFWKSNEYMIRDLKITADVTDTTSQENKQTVLITEQQKQTLESFELSFIVDCKAIDVAPLEIYLNKRLIYSSVPDCGMRIDVPAVDESRLRKGENDLLFRTEHGSFLLYTIEAQLNFKEPMFPTYFFVLDEKTYEKIEADDADINVSLVFLDDGERKRGEVSINGYITEVDTFDDRYSRNIDSFVRQGNNAVQIRPLSDWLDILELKILLAE